MTLPKPGQWTRRRLLQTLPAMLAPGLFPAEIRAAANAAKTTPFSRFVDVSANAGLTETMFYGDSNHNTYICLLYTSRCV